MMLKMILPALFIQCCVFVANAQEPEKITVKAGEDISEVLSSYGMYRFPAFADGTVTFRNGNAAPGKMNFNIYLGLVQFIDAKGDTLTISNPETIDSVAIGDHLFYYRNGYYQVMANYDNCKLVMKQIVKFRPVKIGAFGVQLNSNTGQSYESISTPGLINSRLVLNEDIVVTRQTSYYLFYKKYREEEASKQGFFNAFPNYKDQVQAFIKENKTDFKKLDDLKKLTAFCSSQK